MTRIGCLIIWVTISLSSHAQIVIDRDDIPVLRSQQYFFMPFAQDTAGYAALSWLDEELKSDDGLDIRGKEVAWLGSGERFWNFGGYAYDHLTDFADAVHQAVLKENSAVYMDVDLFFAFIFEGDAQLTLPTMLEQVDIDPAGRNVFHLDGDTYGGMVEWEMVDDLSSMEADTMQEMAFLTLSNEHWNGKSLFYGDPQPIITGVDAYGMELYKTDANGNILYERTIDTVVFDHRREMQRYGFSAREDWVLNDDGWFKVMDVFQPFQPSANPQNNDLFFKSYPGFLTPQRWKAKRLEVIVPDVSYAVPIELKGEVMRFYRLLISKLNSDDVELFDLREVWLTQAYKDLEFPMFRYLKKDIENGAIEPVDMSDPSCFHAWAYELIDHGSHPVVEGVDSYGNVIYKTDQYNNIVYERSIDTLEIPVDQIVGIEFHEDWCQDRKTKALVKRVKGVRLILMEIDVTGKANPSASFWYFRFRQD